MKKKVFEDVEMLVKCNNCGWSGNDSSLKRAFSVDGNNLAEDEICRLNDLSSGGSKIKVDVEDILFCCPCCMLDEGLMDLEHLGRLELFVIESSEVGGEKDTDQMLRLIDKDKKHVATFEMIVEKKEYRVEVLNQGEQNIFIEKDASAKIVPLGEGIRERVCDATTLLEVQELDRKDGGKEYVVYSDCCWLEVDIYSGDKKVYSSYENDASTYGTIAEAISSIYVDFTDAVQKGKVARF